MPVEYQKGIASIDQVLRMCWGIVGRSDDERIRLQALALIDQCNSHKMDMITNGTIISDALKYVNGKADAENKPLQDEGEEEEVTTDEAS
jgi:hypothetical protein